MKYKFTLQNLDCANCAREIEEHLTKNPTFKHVIVNFNTLRLSFDSDQKISLQEINRLIQEVEPEVTAVNESTMLDSEMAATSDSTTPKSHNHTYSFTIMLIGLTIGLLTYCLTLPPPIKFAGFLIAYGILLYRTFINATKILISNHTVNEDSLVTISCIGAFLIGEPLEGMMVIVLYTIGKILEERAVNTSRRSIQDLINIKVPYATVKRDSQTEQIKVEDIKIGDQIIVKKGEKVPVDGKIIKGQAILDMSALTGESLPVDLSRGEDILSGSINLGKPFEMRATQIYADSTVTRILDLLENATDRKAKTETIVNRISKFYTPTILLLAILVGIILPTIFHIPISDAIYRSLTFLVIACPCAIAISVPLAYFTGIGVASKQGILIKGSNYLDNLSQAKQIIFDKTGTLTDGNFVVSQIKIYDPNYSEKRLIKLVTQGEALSTHPIAKSVLKLTKNKIDTTKVRHFQEKSGEGISYQIDKDKIIIGNQKACQCTENATLHVNINRHHVASIFITDQIRPAAALTIEQLKQLGLITTMFTGDKHTIATNIGHELEIDHVYSGMLPEDKFLNYEKVHQNNLTIFVGDGINDAPVLRRADIGIAMGKIGSAAAIEAADIVIMNDNLTKILQAIQISRYTKRIIYQNLIFAIIIKLTILILSTLGLVNMWWAVFADTGVTLLAILNTMRILYTFSKRQQN